MHTGTEIRREHEDDRDDEPLHEDHSVPVHIGRYADRVFVNPRAGGVGLVDHVLDLDLVAIG